MKLPWRRETRPTPSNSVSEDARAALGRPLAWLALLVPLPLPLNQVIVWPVLFAFWALVAVALQRFDDPDRRGLSDRALNLLGLAYLPVLFVDASSGVAQNQLLRPLLHLILFLLVAKLWSMRRARDPWHVLVAIFFLFVASMATSTHVTSLLYLLATVAFGLHVLGRFLQLHVVANTAARGGALTISTASPAGGRPLRRRTQAAALLAIALLAVPIFASLPRLREPLLIGRGGGNLGASRATGFSDSVDLSLTSEIRDNPAIALRLEPETRLADAADLRLKGASYDLYRDTRWERGTLQRTVRLRDGVATVSSREVASRVTIYRQPLASSALPIPYTTQAIELRQRRVPEVLFDAGGAAFLPGTPPRQTLIYSVRLGTDILSLGVDPRRNALDEASQALDDEGTSPRLEALAADVAGEGTARERAERIERHLLENYDYTLDFVGREGVDPVNEFLFEYRSGHCELFATSMVLMLRSQGIPARFVTGFLGAEENRIENFYVVRQSNAHAWVEAWLDEGGWEVFDPTPPDGRPLTAQRDLRLLVRQLYDFAVFRWDRYVLTYGVDDQQQVFADLRERLGDLRQRLAAWWGAWRDRDESSRARAETPVPGLAIDPETSTESGRETAPGSARWLLAAWALAALGLLAGATLWARRRPLAPSAAYERLRQRLGTYDPALGAASAPLALRERAAAAYPPAAEGLRQIVDLYLEDRFARSEPSAQPTVRLRSVLRRVEGEIRQVERRRRAEQRRRESATLSST